MTTSVEILRDSTGAAAGPELVAGVTNMPTARFDQLAERLLAEPPHPSATPPQTEVWPLVAARASTFATGGGANYSDAPGAAGLNLNAAMNPRYAGSGRFSDGVLRALLYCQGLVVEDPVVLAAELYLTTSHEARPVARRARDERRRHFVGRDRPAGRCGDRPDLLHTQPVGTRPAWSKATDTRPISRRTTRPWPR